MIRRILAVLFLVACVPVGLVGCTTVAEQIKSEEVALYDEKALLILEETFSTALDVYAALDASGVITPEREALAKVAFEKAYNGLLKARAAYDLGSTIDATAKAVTTRDAMGVVVGLAALLNSFRSTQG